VVIGVTSTDSLFHISAEETNANLEPGSRLRRIAQHLLQQRSYYPLFPPPVSMPTHLDSKEMHKWQMPCQPDLLIVPSKLTSFASVVLDSTVVINPGHLSKGTTGGTYALMDIHPMKRDVLDNAGGDDVQLPHGVSDRVSVEVKRI
jgi:DNA polymerase alpha subunit B